MVCFERIGPFLNKTENVVFINLKPRDVFAYLNNFIKKRKFCAKYAKGWSLHICTNYVNWGEGAYLFNYMPKGWCLFEFAQNYGKGGGLYLQIATSIDKATSL